MWKNQSCLLTEKDFGILQHMMQRNAEHDGPMVRLLRWKTENARLLPDAEMPEDAVTLNSRVSYRIGAAPLETRIVSIDRISGPVSALLPITTLRGLALLGLSEGQRCTLARSADVTEALQVVRVHYQPQRASRSRPPTHLPRFGLIEGGKRAQTRMDLDSNPGLDAAYSILQASGITCHPHKCGKTNR